jgi:membrane protein YqaA with SNARE-associated domain
MRLFSALYDQILRWAGHRHAPIYLAFLSFIEAACIPMPPPELMLAPMSISQPEKAWWYAALTTISSALGGIVGYLLGMFFIALIEPYLTHLGYQAAYYKVQHWFLTWGFYALFFAGFTPIPYKVFTITSGAVGLPLFPFMVASLVGRGSRFYLVSGLMRVGGPKMKDQLRKYIDWFGWILLALVLVLLAIYFFRK